jgi:hypothetical protein
MLLEQGEVATALRWYWTYSLATPTSCTRSIARIDHWLLLARIAAGPYPLSLGHDETAALFDWIAANDTLAAAFPYLAADEKALLRRVYRTSWSRAAPPGFPSAAVDGAAFCLAPRRNQSKLAGLLSWWKGVVIRIKSALRFFP